MSKRTYSDSTPEVDYYYDNQTLPTTKPPNFTPTYSKGRLIAACYGGASSSAGNYQSYDQLGRVTSSYQQTDAINYGFSYGYNLASEITSETYPSGRQVITEYDSTGRAAGIRAAAVYYAGAAASDSANRIQYASQGAVSIMKLGNSKWAHTNFNNRLQPKQIGLGTSGTDSSWLKLDYEYTSSCQTANNGNVMKQTINASGLTLTQTYCYDALNRLSGASENNGANWTQSYDYDRFGNRAVRSGSYLPTPRQTPTSNSPSDLSFLFNQSNNRITATSDYGYDASGNLSSMPDKTQGVAADVMTYDAENRQKIFNATGGQYFYDGDGHRVKKVTGSVTTVFVYNAMGEFTAEYTNDTTPPVGGGGTSYLTTDHLGSTRLVTGTNQTQPVKARYDYLPFGEEIPSNIGGRGSVAGYGGADSTKQEFTQKERDSESALDYFLARYYSAAQGRFTSSDEFTGGPVELSNFADQAAVNPTFYADLRNPQSLNKYQYAYNNPLRFVDPDGHDVEYENERLQQQFQNIAKESKTFSGELAELSADHKIVLVVVERGLKTNDEKSSGDATITFKPDGTTRVVIAVDSYGRTLDQTKVHEVGHAKDARTNRDQLKKDALATKKNKGGPAEKAHDDRPEEKRANAFRDQVEREREEYKKQQKAERKRQGREKKQE